VLNTNHVISKQVVNLAFDVIALEKLESSKMRRKGNGKSLTENSLHGLQISLRDSWNTRHRILIKM
jgi:hypothetical protein